MHLRVLRERLVELTEIAKGNLVVDLDKMNLWKAYIHKIDLSANTTILRAANGETEMATACEVLDYHDSAGFRPVDYNALRASNADYLDVIVDGKGGFVKNPENGAKLTTCEVFEWGRTNVG